MREGEGSGKGMDEGCDATVDAGRFDISNGERGGSSPAPISVYAPAFGARCAAWVDFYRFISFDRGLSELLC